MSGVVTALVSLITTICLKNICSGAGTRAAAVFRQEDYYYAYAAVCGIGGLAVGETHDEMYRILDAVVPHLPENTPTYLMGV